MSLHEIVAGHPSVVAADRAIAEVDEALARYEDKLAAVKAEHQQACADAARVFDPQPETPALLTARGPDFMFERHTRTQARRVAIGKAAAELAPKLSARYDEAFAELRDLLDPALALAEEIRTLLASYATVASGQRTWAHADPTHRLRESQSLLKSVEPQQIGALDVIAAALSGSRLMPEILACRELTARRLPLAEHHRG